AGHARRAHGARRPLRAAVRAPGARLPLRRRDGWGRMPTEPPMATSTSPARANLVFPEKDQALREAVHRLGQLVGELVREQGGEALFDIVEAARRASIARREGDPAAYDELAKVLGALAPSTARELIRAFSTYFQVVNMAEKVHRIRRRREYLRDAKAPQ